MKIRFCIMLISACVAPIVGVAPVYAQDRASGPGMSALPINLSGTASLLSQYRFRGVSRSDGGIAVQGDLGASLASGIYAGVMLASVRSGPAGDFGHAEMDIYAGFDHALGSGGMMLDLGLRGYLYADRSSANLVELSAALHQQLGPLDLRAGLAYAPPQSHLGRDFQSGSLRDNTYLFAEGRADIPSTPLHVHAHVGHTAGGLDYTAAYTDYRLGVGASHNRLGLDLSLVGTTISRNAALAIAQGPTADPAAIWRAARSAGVATLSCQF